METSEQCMRSIQSTIKTPERCHLRLLTLNRFHTRSSVSIVDIEQVNAGWEENI